MSKIVRLLETVTASVLLVPLTFAIWMICLFLIPNGFRAERMAFRSVKLVDDGMDCIMYKIDVRLRIS